MVRTSKLRPYIAGGQAGLCAVWSCFSVPFALRSPVTVVSRWGRSDLVRERRRVLVARGDALPLASPLSEMTPANSSGFSSGPTPTRGHRSDRKTRPWNAKPEYRFLGATWRRKRACPDMRACHERGPCPDQFASYGLFVRDYRFCLRLRPPLGGAVRDGAVDVP